MYANLHTTLDTLEVLVIQIEKNWHHFIIQMQLQHNSSWLFIHWLYEASYGNLDFTEMWNTNICQQPLKHLHEEHRIYLKVQR